MTILETAIKCMNAAYEVSPDDLLSESDIVDRSDELITAFKKKWNIKKDIGNADVWDSDKYEEVRADHNKLQRKLFELSWGWMVEITDWGVGDVANEVLMEELFGVKPSWEKPNATK